jgi:hypothetical protein
MSAREVQDQREAEARLDYDAANRAHSRATTSRNHARNRAEAIRGKMNQSSARAHEAIDVLVERADDLFSAGASEYVAGLARIPSEPSAPPAQLAAYFAVRDSDFVAALHAEVDRTASDNRQSSLIPDKPDDLRAELEKARADLAEAEAEVERTYDEQVKAAEHLTAVINGHD